MAAAGRKLRPSSTHRPPMLTITVILMMLLAVVVSGMVVRALPLPVPLPLVQIGLGALIAMATDFRMELHPDVFFLLFLPPLLFLDGWRIPKDDLFRDKGTILEMAFGLVICTVLGIGLLLHWLIPAMPLAVAFALAAVLSPTDPVAVASVARRVPIPKRVMHILEGESLLNDASGLVCLRFATAAALTGAFSLPQAMSTFLWLAVGGIGIGWAVTRAITFAKGWFASRYGEDSGAQILISLLIPFAAYLAAEHAQASGILAAVAAGITMSYTEISGTALATTRIRRNAVWDTVHLALGGIIFVLLGEQLPHIVAEAAQATRESGHDEVWWLAVYVLVLYAALALLRFAWVWLSMRFTLFRGSRKNHEPLRPGWRLVAAMSVAGARGTITLAGVLTLPVVLADGSEFPARDLAIFLAAGVIILSMVIANLSLPRLLRDIELPPEPSPFIAEDHARLAAAQAAIKAVEQAQFRLAQDRPDADVYAQAASRIMGLYRERIDARNDDASADSARHYDRIERSLRLTGLAAERAELFRLLRQHRIDESLARQLVREIDLLELRYQG